MTIIECIISYAFDNCHSLTEITITSSVTSIGSNAFSFCSSLTSITIPNSVTSIGSYAFSGCSSLEGATIGNGVTSIGDYAFNNCSCLTTVNYTGTEEQWNAITVGSNNTPLNEANKNYNYVITQG